MKRPHFAPSIMKEAQARAYAFTLLELMTVMAIIAVLAGLVLKGAGYAQNKAARDRAAAEIAAISVALESYKADNGEYPAAHPDDTNRKVNLTSVGSNAAPSSYAEASIILYRSISFPATGRKVYFEAKPDILSTGTANPGADTHFIDPFGNPYGYAIPNGAANPNTYNPTFDLWSTAGQSGSTATTQKQEKWITNW